MRSLEQHREVIVVPLMQYDGPPAGPGCEGVRFVPVAGMREGHLQYCDARIASSDGNDDPHAAEHHSPIRLAVPAIQQLSHQRRERVEPRSTGFTLAGDGGPDELGRHDDHPAQATSLTEH
ncbi:hypothetical protein GCM10009554_61560 [Kribbella koreensis]|uniref:Uncharacterized protein n=1 Tax=Kribbella koreensis TaxID=57909 RepID=A0ABN1RCJ8_9ACTN